MGQQLTVTLSDDLADMVREKVRSGEYASVDAVIGEALERVGDEGTASRSNEMEAWLRAEAVQRCIGIEQEPSSGRTSEQVRVSLSKEYDRLIAERS